MSAFPCMPLHQAAVELVAISLVVTYIVNIKEFNLCVIVLSSLSITALYGLHF